MTEWRTKWKDSALADAIWIAIAEYETEAMRQTGVTDKTYQRAADKLDAAIEALIEACVAEELEEARKGVP